MDDIIQTEHDYLLQVYARPDIVFTGGQGSTLYDSRGNAYLDLSLIPLSEPTRPY